MALELITALVLAVAGTWVLLCPLPIQRRLPLHMRIADVAPRVTIRPHRRTTIASSANSPDH